MTDITAYDFYLAGQPVQRHFVMIKLLNREKKSISTLSGRLVSGSVDISSGSPVRRSASLCIVLSDSFTVPQSELSSLYARLLCGIEDAAASAVRWYGMGVFTVSDTGLCYDSSTNTLTLTLCDLMCELDGRKSGELSAYSTVIKSSESINKVIEDVLDLCGISQRDICSVGALRPEDSVYIREEYESDSLVPYDLTFPAGASAYDIISRCVGLYPYYESGFDAEGTFFVRRRLFEQDSSSPVIDACSLAPLVISESRSADLLSVKNVVDVWGKDGLYHARAKNENPASPFQPEAVGERLLTAAELSDGIDPDSICDRYKDSVLAAELSALEAKYENEAANARTPEEKQEAQRKLAGIREQEQQNISVSGDELAMQWAKKLVYDCSEMNDTITLRTVLLPFLNDAGAKISYRTRNDGAVNNYIIRSVSHDLSDCTTTITAARFYNEQCTALQSELPAPEITACSVSGMTVTVQCSIVSFAQSYMLLVDNRTAAVSSGTVLSCTLSDEYAGEHLVSVRACAPGFRPNTSGFVRAEFSPYDLLTDHDGDHITTENGERIIV